MPQHKISRKAKNKMGGRCPDGSITNPGNTRLEETSWDREEWRRSVLREAWAQKELQRRTWME
jgi:hypothetical protein